MPLFSWDGRVTTLHNVHNGTVVVVVVVVVQMNLSTKLSRSRVIGTMTLHVLDGQDSQRRKGSNTAHPLGNVTAS